MGKLPIEAKVEIKGCDSGAGTAAFLNHVGLGFMVLLASIGIAIVVAACK
jgi:hypothetical protein